MIVNYLDVKGVPFAPAKADSPLVIDPDAVLAPSIAGQFLKAITRGKPKVTQSIRSVENRKFALGKPLQLHVESAYTLANKDLLSVPISKRPYHNHMITLFVNIVNR